MHGKALLVRALLLPLFMALVAEGKSSTSDGKEYCLTSQCDSAAMNLYDNMNFQDIDPCKNWHECKSHPSLLSHCLDMLLTSVVCVKLHADITARELKNCTQMRTW